MPVRSPGPIRQPLHPTGLIAREDLVAGLGGDINPPPTPPHLPPTKHGSHKPQSFVHSATLPPRHLGFPQMPESVTHVPGMKCHLCARMGNGSIRPRSTTRHERCWTSLGRVDRAPTCTV